MSVYKKILLVMKDLSTVGKDCFVETGQYNLNGKPKGYFAVTHDHVAKLVHPLLVKHGLLVLPSVNDCKFDRYEKVSYYKGSEQKKEVFKVELTVSVRFQCTDDAESYHECEVPAYAIDSQDKAAGKALSMAVKYAILKTFVLESGDQEEERPLEEAAPKQAPVTKEPVKGKQVLINDIAVLCSEITSHMSKDEKIEWLKKTLLIDNLARLKSEKIDDLERIKAKLKRY